MSELLGERVPEGGGNNGEGPFPPGPAPGPGEEVGVRRSEVAVGVCWCRRSVR